MVGTYKRKGGEWLKQLIGEDHAEAKLSCDGAPPKRPTPLSGSKSPGMNSD